jgi:hypothetical protein
MNDTSRCEALHLRLSIFEVCGGGKVMAKKHAEEIKA